MTARHPEFTVAELNVDPRCQNTGFWMVDCQETAPSSAPPVDPTATVQTTNLSAPQGSSVPTSVQADMDLPTIILVKYNTGVYGFPHLADGQIHVSKSTVSFHPTFGAERFRVAREKIREARIIADYGAASRIRLKVFLSNRNGGERTAQFEFYNAAANVVNRGRGNVDLKVIECPVCDDSLDRLIALLKQR